MGEEEMGEAGKEETGEVGTEEEGAEIGEGVSRQA